MCVCVSWGDLCYLLAVVGKRFDPRSATTAGKASAAPLPDTAWYFPPSSTYRLRAGGRRANTNERILTLRCRCRRHEEAFWIVPMNNETFLSYESRTISPVCNPKQRDTTLCLITSKWCKTSNVKRRKRQTQFKLKPQTNR